MKRRVVYSKDNKRSFRWLQAAGQCKAPFTVVVDLSFARAIVREANLSPSLKQSAIVHFGGNATKLMNDKLETPCRVVVTAATMAAADKYRNEVRDAQQAKRKEQQEKEKQQKKEQGSQQNQQKEDKKKASSSKAVQQQENILQQQQQQTKENHSSYVEEDFRIANDVRAFLKSCELWSPPPVIMETKGPGNEQKAVAEAILFGRPSMEVRPANARPHRHGIIVATHNPDTKNEITSALSKFNANNEVAVCVLRCLTKPFSLRVDPMNENMKNTTMGGGNSSMMSGDDQHNTSSSNFQQQQPLLSQRAAADLHFVKKLQEQNLISNKKANFVVKNIGGDSVLNSKKMKQQQQEQQQGNSTPSSFKIEKRKVQDVHEKTRIKKAKKENDSSSSSSNPLATKKKLVRVPLKISKH